MVGFTIHRLRHAVYLWLPVSATVVFVLQSTTPDRIGPQGITVFFGLLFAFFALSLQVMMLFLARVKQAGWVREHWHFRYAVVFSFIPTIALALNSLDQLVFRDILIFAGLAVLGGFYLAKRG